LTAGFPDRGVAIFLLAFFVEPVHLCYLAGFVVATDQHYPVGVSSRGILAGGSAAVILDGVLLCF
jgi:hypothetical protein